MTIPRFRSWRVDYADGTSWHSHQGPPPVKGVLAVVYWQDPPYRSLRYGHMHVGYWVAGVWLPGEQIDDDDWETYRVALHAEPHPYAEA